LEFVIHRQKIQQALEHLKEDNVDLWIILTHEGQDPSLPLVTGVATVGKGAFLFTKEGDKYAICNNIDAQDIVQSNLFDKVITYSNSFEEKIKEQVKEISPSNIALNYSINDHLADGLTVGQYRSLTKALDNVFDGAYLSSETFLQHIRSVKTEPEINIIKKAIDLTLKIYESVFKELKVGLSEREVGQLFIEELKKHNVLNGIDRKVSMPIVMKENISHREPGQALIEPGDLLIIDFSIDLEGYTSDVARTVYFLKEEEKEAPAKVQKVFNCIHEAISQARKTLKPGVKGLEVDKAAREYLLEKGLPDITHSVGHQMGREVHDGGMLLAPPWERYGNAPYGVVEKGMVFTIEPTVFMEDGIHFIVEENVYVTEEGAEYLTERQDQLILIPFA